MPRAVALAVASWLIAWSWLRLEHGSDASQALLIVALAVAPALVNGLRTRIAVGVVAFLVAAGSAFGQAPGLHYPGRVLSRFGQGFLDFYDFKLPFAAAAEPRMHGTIMLAVFAFTLPAALAIVACKPRWAALALLVGAGWPATLLDGHELLRGAALLAGLLVVLVALRERPRAVGYAPVAGIVVILLAVVASSSAALARHGFVNWRSWDFYTHPAKPVSVSYVWDSNYSGLTFPRKETVVLKIKAPRRPQYWRVVPLDAVVNGRWIVDAALREQTDGTVAEPGMLPTATIEGRNLVRQEVTVEALRDRFLPAGDVPTFFDAPSLGQLLYDPTGIAYLQRGLQHGDSYGAWSYEPHPTPAELVRSKPVYPRQIADDREYLEVERHVWVPPFGTRGRTATMEHLFASVSAIDPYRPLYQRALDEAGDAKSPYAATVALESWFRTGGSFAYDQHPPRSHGIPPLVDFVTQTHRGYCQHFAGAMALMLRYLGIPARAVAGFSSGQYDARSHEWVVTDHDAHEWVEAWFRGWGWLPFDPTPGRGGLAGGYSASSKAFDLSAAAAALAGKDGLKSFNRHQDELGFDRRVLRLSSDIRNGLLPGAPPQPHHSRAPGFLRLLVLILAALVVLIALVKLVLRRSRYLTRNPRRLAAAYRKELRDILLDQVVDVPSSATLIELARLFEDELGVEARRLGLHGTAARFGPPGHASEALRELRRAMQKLRRDLRTELTRVQRTRGLLSLRSLGLA